jgi:hypothetical protein
LFFFIISKKKLSVLVVSFLFVILISISTTNVYWMIVCVRARVYFNILNFSLTLYEHDPVFLQTSICKKRAKYMLTPIVGRFIVKL